jgi:hypothetical protein
MSFANIDHISDSGSHVCVVKAHFLYSNGKPPSDDDEASSFSRPPFRPLGSLSHIIFVASAVAVALSFPSEHRTTIVADPVNLLTLSK